MEGKWGAKARRQHKGRAAAWNIRKDVSLCGELKCLARVTLFPLSTNGNERRKAWCRARIGLLWGRQQGLSAIPCMWMHTEQTEEHCANQKIPGSGCLGRAERRLLG